MHTANVDLEKLNRDGYLVIKSVLDPAKVEAAQRRFEELYQTDVESRHQRQVHDTDYKNGPVGHTILSKASHLMLDVFGKNAAFDDILEQLLADPAIRRAFEAWSGPNFMIGSCNIRYMTGAYDPPPAHELHRDSQRSMNLVIMLSDVEEGDNAATAVVPGSHRYPSCPRWDCLVSEPFRLRKDPSRPGLSFFLRWNVFNRLLRMTLPRTTGAFGRQGDVYFMGNGELWHGRLPNVHGRRTMICLIGLFGIDEKNIKSPAAVPREALAKLPPRLAKALGGPFMLNDPSNSMLERLYKARKPATVVSLFYWAALERRFFEWISDVLTRPTGVVAFARKVGRKLRVEIARPFRRLWAPVAR